MNILVTGANGQLGNEMRIVSKDSNDRFVFTDVIEAVGLKTTILDITDLDAIRNIVKDKDIQVIVNCAAYTNVDAAENNEALAEKLNADAPKNLATAIKEVNGLLIHISTDYVFGGDSYNTPCKEDQQGTPTGVYGKSKLHGEQGVVATNCNYVILRTSWLYSEYGNNFAKTMLNLTSSKPRLNVVFDQVGTPTYALDLANVISVIICDYKKELSNNNQWSSYTKKGIYNYSNEGVCSWFDFTKFIAEYSGNFDCDIRPCHSDEFPSPVKRPAFSVLDKTKIKKTFGILIPYWTNSLRNCVDNIVNKK